MRTLYILIFLFSALAGFAEGKKPRLVVNIVVSGLREDVLRSMKDKFEDDGFNRFLNKGVVFTQSRYNFMPQGAITGLSTISTGVNPSEHAVIGKRWVERTTNEQVYLTDNSDVVGVGCDAGLGKYSSSKLTFPTLGDQLRKENKKSKVVSIALEAESAVVLGGVNSKTYWMDKTRGRWISSSSFMDKLPLWLEDYNKEQIVEEFMRLDPDVKNEKRNKSMNFSNILKLTSGNAILTDMAKQAVVYERLGVDDNTDLLNICYDVPREVVSLYGKDSLRVEQMYQRLDVEIGDFVNFISAQLSAQDLLFVLSSDSGMSDVFDEKDAFAGQFDVAKYMILANAFLNSQYGTGDWVVDFNNGQLYLNHNHIYNSKLKLDEVQQKLVAFSLQFRGVSHVFTSSALQSSHFGSGIASLVQQGFYPKRSGDVVLVLQPGWIELQQDRVALSGSAYHYDRHVPLIFMGGSLEAERVEDRVDMCQVAPTLAYIMQIQPPMGSDAEPLKQVKNKFNYR